MGRKILQKPKMIQQGLALGLDKKLLTAMAKSARERTAAAEAQLRAKTEQRAHGRVAQNFQQLSAALESGHLNGLPKEERTTQPELRINPAETRKSPPKISAHWKLSFMQAQQKLAKEGLLDANQIIFFDNLETRFQNMALNKGKLLAEQKDAENRIRWAIRTHIKKRELSEAAVANYSAAAYRDFRIISTLLVMHGVKLREPLSTAHPKKK